MMSHSTLSGADGSKQWYLVFHHYKEELVRTIIIGIFPSLISAQHAALAALKSQLARCEAAGLRGRYFEQIDLETKGLITIVKDNSELPLSEFEIVLDGYAGRPALPLSPMRRFGSASDMTLLTNLAGPIRINQSMIPMANFNLAPIISSPPISTASGIFRTDPDFKWPEEKDPAWAQSKQPIFRRRDERPLLQFTYDEPIPRVSLPRAAPKNAAPENAPPATSGQGDQVNTGKPLNLGRVSILRRGP